MRRFINTVLVGGYLRQLAWEGLLGWVVSREVRYEWHVLVLREKGRGEGCCCRCRAYVVD